jgi:3-dehydroquinate synthetase
MRGVPLVQCPTTLLAMVDASVGGKTGVDLPQGKNLVGAFKQPVAVVADVDTLRTLPPTEFAAGMAEVVKHGLLAGGDLLRMLESRAWRQEILFQPGADGLMEELVSAAIEVKRDVVQEDPYEQGRRATLNLGHTFAHAIERQSRYAVSHGYAVAMGLVAAARLSAKFGHCDLKLQERVEVLLRRFTLPVRIPPELGAEDLLKAMGNDKKKARGQLRFILIRAAGDVFISSNVPASAVIETIEELQKP